MHISHIIMVAKTLRFMSAFLLLRFLRRHSVRDGGIITPSAANVNPLFTFLCFSQKIPQDRYAISSNVPQIKQRRLTPSLSCVSINPTARAVFLSHRGSSRGQSPPRIGSNAALSLALQGVRGAKRIFSCRFAARKYRHYFRLSRKADGFFDSLKSAAPVPRSFHSLSSMVPPPSTTSPSYSTTA